MHTDFTPPWSEINNHCRDWWAPTPSELLSLARFLGFIPRIQNDFVLISQRELGSHPKVIAKNLEETGTFAKRIKDSPTQNSWLFAAVFYNVRFLHIHPLKDGNGRLGRVILAAQCELGSRVPREEIMTSIHSFSADYKMAFVPTDNKQRFELLLDLMGQITGTVVNPSDYVVAYPLSAKPGMTEAQVREIIKWKLKSSCLP